MTNARFQRLIGRYTIHIYQEAQFIPASTTQYSLGWSIFSHTTLVEGLSHEDRVIEEFIRLIDHSILRTNGHFLKLLTKRIRYYETFKKIK